MRHKWRFFGFFALYSLILSILWFKIYLVYMPMPADLAGWLLQLFYTGDVVELAMRDGRMYLRFPEYAPDRAYQTLNMVFNVVPFLALVLATPRLTRLKIFLTILFGLTILLFLHAASIIAIFFRVATSFFWKDALYYFVATLLEALAPLILWFAFIGREFLFLEPA